MMTGLDHGSGSVLRPFLFAVVIDEVRLIEVEIPWCMLFADDSVLVDEIRDEVNVILELSFKKARPA